MWGQPPSAVRASEARRLLAASQIPELVRILGEFDRKPLITGSHDTTIKTQRSFALRTAESGCPHTPMPQAFYRRQLPHLQCDDRQHFITFCTDHRWLLPGRVRSIVLESCLHDNGTKLDLRVAVVMPDHVHMIFTPLINEPEMEVYSLAEIMNAVKGSSAHKVNKVLRRKGRVWQPESLDHVLRSSESLDAKIIYLLENPVRAGLVEKWTDYPWLWKKPFVNPFSPS